MGGLKRPPKDRDDTDESRDLFPSELMNVFICPPATYTIINYNIVLNTVYTPLKPSNEKTNYQHEINDKLQRHK